MIILNDAFVLFLLKPTGYIKVYIGVLFLNPLRTLQIFLNTFVFHNSAGKDKINISAVPHMGEGEPLNVAPRTRNYLAVVRNHTVFGEKFKVIFVLKKDLFAVSYGMSVKHRTQRTQKTLF